MALQAGTRLGPYEITAQIGEGGMGEVYQATDTNLKRSVAIKVLPETVAGDSERLARFQREAETLAALNHPGIAAIYGLEDSEGTKALVMELVEGPTLADRIAQGAIPVDEALPIAKQIAEALEAAHEQGIIHRDLKPANIKLRPDGTVKVLDFGLAKAMKQPGAASPSVSQSPTITTPAMTQMGMILGTAAYMSPEQARGAPVDKRADIWAFGAVLYEMVVGVRVFEGDRVSDVLAATLRGEPNWTALPATLPPNVGAFLRRCLEKDPRDRVRDVGDLRLVLSGAFENDVVPPAGLDAGRLAWYWVAVALLAGGAVVGIAMTLASQSPVTERADLLQFAIRPEVPLADTAVPEVAISRDGRNIAFIAQDPNEPEQVALFTRTLESLESRYVEDSRGAWDLFFPDDGQSVGFMRNSDPRQLARVDAAGVVAVPATLIRDDIINTLGATLGPDQTIVYGWVDGLYRASLDGTGSPERLLEAGENEYMTLPDTLPDGTGVLFDVRDATTQEAKGLMVLDLASGDARQLVANASHPRYVASGHLLFSRDGQLFAAPFDLDALTMTREPVALPLRVRQAIGVAADYAVSDTGTLVYVPEVATETTRTAVWVDRLGSEIGAVSEPIDGLTQVRLAPGGGQFAATVGEGTNTSIWLFDLEGRPPVPLVRGGSPNDPAWSPDGERLAFGANFDSGLLNFHSLFEVRVGAGLQDAESLLTGEVDRIPGAWTPNGQGLIYQERPTPATSDWEIFAWSRGDGSMRPIVQGDSSRNPAVSPNGRYLAYVSDISGSDEVWVRSLVEVEAPQRVSTNGGLEPVWSPVGDELFYLEGSKLMAAAVETAGLLRVRQVTELFDAPYFRELRSSYDVAEDGRQFLMIRADEDLAEAEEIVVVQNWFTELERLVPTE